MFRLVFWLNDVTDVNFQVKNCIKNFGRAIFYSSVDRTFEKLKTFVPLPVQKKNFCLTIAETHGIRLDDKLFPGEIKKDVSILHVIYVSKKVPINLTQNMTGCFVQRETSKSSKIFVSMWKPGKNLCKLWRIEIEKLYLLIRTLPLLFLHLVLLYM